jgi:protein phosphatase
MQSIGISDKGIRREKNEDSFYRTDGSIGALKNLYAVCDGMGGHKAGEVASQTAIDVLTECIMNHDYEDAVSVIQDSITEANKEVYSFANSDRSRNGMGTTLVAATIDENNMTVANVGDSRLYVISKDKIRQITVDHSVVEELLRSGAITEDSEIYHAQKHKITRAVGAEETVDIDFFHYTLSMDDYVLLCSDGLTNEVKNEEILTVVSGEGSVEEKAKTLVNLANEHGGNDNITVLLIKPF